MKPHHNLAEHSQFDSRECKYTPHRGNKLIFLPTFVWKSFVSFKIHPRRSWLVYSPRVASYTTPIDPYPTCMSFPYYSYLGKESVARFSRHSWGRNAWRTLRESAREATQTFASVGCLERFESRVFLTGSACLSDHVKVIFSHSCWYPKWKKKMK